jgi:hypothetical protein
MFDATCDGARLKKRDFARIVMPAGDWAIDLADQRGRAVDRGVETRWTASVVRLRR